MAILTIRNVPDEVHRALRVRAVQHGGSTEAEVREILATVVKPPSRVRVGDALSAIGRKIGLTNEDVAILERERDTTPYEAAGVSVLNPWKNVQGSDTPR